MMIKKLEYSFPENCWKNHSVSSELENIFFIQNNCFVILFASMMMMKLFKIFFEFLYAVAFYCHMFFLLLHSIISFAKPNANMHMPKKFFFSISSRLTLWPTRVINYNLWILFFEPFFGIWAQLFTKDGLKTCILLL